MSQNEEVFDSILGGGVVTSEPHYWQSLRWRACWSHTRATKYQYELKDTTITTLREKNPTVVQCVKNSSNLINYGMEPGLVNIWLQTNPNYAMIDRLTQYNAALGVHRSMRGNYL